MIKNKIIFIIISILYFLWIPIVFLPYFVIWILQGHRPKYSNPDPKEYLGYDNNITTFIINYIIVSNYIGWLLLIMYALIYKKNFHKSIYFYLFLVVVSLNYLILYSNFLNIYEWLLD